MSRKIAVPVLIASLGILRAASADPFLPVPPASFINYHVDTVAQLSQQVAVNAVVRGRLSRHFHLAQNDMVTYIQHNLVLSYLKAPGRYRVACVTPAGREYYISQYLPKGTPVFALASTGQPILKRICGNPLVSALPASAPGKMSRLGGNHSEEPALADAEPTADTPASVVATNTLPATTTLTQVPGIVGGNVGNLGPITNVAGIIQSLGPGVSGFGQSLVIPAVLSAITAVALTGTGSGGSTLVVVPAPEPSPALIYAFGGLGVMVLVIRRRLA